MKIGYLTFGRDDLGYGLALCLDRLKKHEVYRVTPKTAKLVDVLLFSCFWWEHIYLLADFLRKANIKKTDSNRPKIIIGGFNTFNPVPFMTYADFIVCGDGEEILTDVLNGEDPGLTWRNVSLLPGFCHETNDIARIELSRGCKFRCRFCAVSHLKPYRETPIEEIERCLKETKQKRVALFAPEPTLYSQDKEINAMCERMGKIRLDSDVRLDRVGDRPYRVARVGIEGISERLRKSVGKPYKNEYIIEQMDKAIKAGRGGIFFYIILDLPGEQEEDWEEFNGLLRKIGEISGASNFVLKPSPSVFMPNPHTPMEYDSIHWDRDYISKWREFFRGGENHKKWEVMMAERSRIFKPSMRILSMISTRAGEEFFEIENELNKKKIIGISCRRIACQSLPNLLRVLQKYGGPEKYCGLRSPEGENPWKRLII